MAGFAEPRPLDDAPALTVDARGHHCPVPTLRLQKALRDLEAGERVLLLATDPMAKVDVPHFLAGAGEVLVSSEEADGTLSFLVEKRGAAPPS